VSTDEVKEYLQQAERHDRRWRMVGVIAVLVAVLTALAILLMVDANRVPVGDQRAIDTVKAAGFTDVELGAAVTLACAESESSRHFTATNALGKRVDGVVCCGLTGAGKGCTIRWGR
jgi:hypothetical protein